MTLLLETTSSCVSPFIQDAAVEALNSNQLEIDEMIKEFKSRRDLMVSMLNEISGISCISPQRGFLCFCKCI